MPRNGIPAARKRRMAAVYHEAGHVVACFLLKRRFKYATIEPDEDSLGHVLETRLPTSFRPDIDNGLRARAVAEKRILSLFAGEAAEARWRGKHNWRGAAADYHKVANLTSYFCGDVEEEEAYARWLALRARNMVCSEVHWPLVEAVAGALLERNRLAYAEARGSSASSWQPLSEK